MQYVSGSLSDGRIQDNPFIEAVLYANEACFHLLGFSVVASYIFSLDRFSRFKDTFPLNAASL